MQASRPKEHTMSKVFTGASMSLDGYISGPAETGFEHLFKWYGNGDVEVPTAKPEMTPRLSAAERGALPEHDRRTPGRWSSGASCSTTSTAGTATIRWACPSSWSPTACRRAGRARTRRSRSSRTASRARSSRPSALAGDKVVGVNGGTIARQCLDAGLLDEVWIDLVPVLLGDGTPFFDAAEDRPGRARGAGVDRRGHRRHAPALPRPLSVTLLESPVSRSG